MSLGKLFLREVIPTPLEPTPSELELRECCAAKHRKQNLKELLEWTAERKVISNKQHLKNLAEQRFTSIVHVRPLALKSIAIINIEHNPITVPVDAKFGDKISAERFAYDMKQATRYLHHLQGCYQTICGSDTEDIPVHSTYAEWQNEIETCSASKKAFDRCVNDASQDQSAIEARKFNMQDLIGSFITNKILSPKVGIQMIRDAANNWDEDDINEAALAAFADYNQMVASNN